jgi:hypothetical protein
MTAATRASQPIVPHPRGPPVHARVRGRWNRLPGREEHVLEKPGDYQPRPGPSAAYRTVAREFSAAVPA